MFTTAEEAIKYYEDTGALKRVATLMNAMGWTYWNAKTMTEESLVTTIRRLAEEFNDGVTTSISGGGWIIRRIRDLEGTGLDSWNISFDILDYLATTANEYLKGGAK